ncbi:MAG: hypothetical protein RR961_09310 [Eubacterium sp.]
MIIFCGLSGCSNQGGKAERSYTLPEMKIPQYSGSKTAVCTEGSIDFTHANEGYIMANYTGNFKVKLQIVKDDKKYNYDLENTGTYEAFPLQMESGTYTVKLMQNVGDDRL